MQKPGNRRSERGEWQNTHLAHSHLAYSPGPAMITTCWWPLPRRVSVQLPRSCWHVPSRQGHTASVFQSKERRTHGRDHEQLSWRSDEIGNWTFSKITNVTGFSNMGCAKRKQSNIGKLKFRSSGGCSTGLGGGRAFAVLKWRPFNENS